MTTRAQQHSRFGPPPAPRPAPAPGARPEQPKGPARPAPVDGRTLKIAALVVLGLAGFGLIAREVVARSALGQPHPASFNVFFRLYVLHEGPFLWLSALVAALTGLVALRAPGNARAGWESRVLSAVARIPTRWVALGVLAITLVGGLLLLHGIGLAMDEFAASFQAKIFASGQVQAAVPVEWRGLAPWMTPVFVNYKAAAGVWLSSYLPVYAGIRAVFALLRVERLTNPALAALTVMLIVAVARQLWRGEQRARAATLALLFLVLSSQFLLTSMGAYSMAAHLCLNLLWLWLYLRNDAAGLGALPWIGVLAMGLHNPIPHVLFAAPFLVRVVRERRYGWLAYWAAVYGAGAVAWYEWLRFVQTDADGTMAIIGAGIVGSGGLGGGVFNTFALPSLFRLFAQGMSTVLLMTWETPAVALFLAVALVAWRRLGPVERDLAAGLVCTWVFYAFFNADQGHGWGYRYMHAVLGNAILLAVSGAEEVWRAGRQALVARLVLASAVLTVVLQWPLRATQTERFVRPYAATLEYIAGQQAELITIDPRIGWYARDFVRNEPFLEKSPKVLGLGYVAGRWPHVRDVPAAARERTLQLTAKELEALGVPVFELPRQ